MNNRERTLISTFVIVAEILEVAVFMVSEILPAAATSITEGINRPRLGSPRP